MGMTAWDYIHSTIWLTSWNAGPTWGCTHFHPCSSHTSTSHSFRSRGTRYGRSVI